MTFLMACLAITESVWRISRRGGERETLERMGGLGGLGLDLYGGDALLVGVPDF